MNILHINSPLIKTDKIPFDSTSNIFLKLESSQPSGSFKIRGIGLACQKYFEKGARMFIASSGGNAGMAVAYAGKKLNIPVKIIVPESTSQIAIDRIRAQGASVVIHGKDVDESHGYAISLLEDDIYYIHPYNNPYVWTGHSKIIDEVLAENIIPDMIVLSVGGGGLLCGIVEGLNKYNLNHIPILAVETLGANSFENAYKHNSNIGISSVDSLATSLGAKKVADQAFKSIKTNNIRCEVVSDYAAVKACSSFYNQFDILVEPACGASLSVLYNNSLNIKNKKNILIIVCGGIGISKDSLQVWKKELLID